MLIDNEHSMARVESDGSGIEDGGNGSVRTAEVMMTVSLVWFISFWLLRWF
jgi:hypothetical protein